MRSSDGFPKIYLYRGIIDFRRGIDGLCAIVQHQFHLDPFADALFVFIARNKRKMRALYWDRSGFAMWTKRLEKEKFKIPKFFDEVMTLSPREFEMLLDGYDVMRMRPHEKLHFSRFS